MLDIPSNAKNIINNEYTFIFDITDQASDTSFRNYKIFNFTPKIEQEQLESEKRGKQILGTPTEQEHSSPTQDIPLSPSPSKRTNYR